MVILKGEVDYREKMKLSTMLRLLQAENLIDADVLVKDQFDISFYKDKTGSVVRNAFSEGGSL